MKKKIISLFLAIVLIIPCLFMLNSCGKSKPKETPEDPTKFTIVDIQNKVSESLSKGFDNISFNASIYDELFNLEAVNKVIDGKNVLGFYGGEDDELFFINTLKLVVYKDANGKYYFSKKNIKIDNSTDEEQRVKMASAGTSFFADSLIKDDLNEIVEFSDFETYLYVYHVPNGIDEWQLLTKNDESSYTLGRELSDIQKNWFLKLNTESNKYELREEFTVEEVYPESFTNATAEEGRNYYKITYKQSGTPSTRKFIAGQSSGSSYCVALISYEKTDVEIDSSFIKFLNQFNSEKVEGFDNFYYYNIDLKLNDGDQNFDKSIEVLYRSEWIDGFTKDEGYFLLNEKEEVLDNHNLSEYGYIETKSFECVILNYFVQDGNNYYLLEEYFDGFPTLFGTNYGKSIKRVKYELTEPEYKSYLSSINSSWSIVCSEMLSKDDLLSVNQEEVDRIKALYGENAYKSTFKIDDGATKEQYSATIERTIIANGFHYENVFITADGERYYANNPLANETIKVEFKDGKLVGFSVSWKVQEEFVLTNSENDTEEKYSDIKNETQIINIKFNRNDANLTSLDLNGFKDLSLDSNSNIQIDLRNALGDDNTISQINGVDIKAGSTITKADLDSLVSDKLPQGVTIENWYLDYNYQIPAIIDGKLNVSKYEDMALFAKYSKTPNVTFNLNGGTMEQIEVRYGDTLDDCFEMKSLPYKSGYEFEGFYTDEAFENKVDFHKFVFSEDVTLYAKYTKLYVAEFDTKGGKLIGNEIINEGDALINLPESVEKIGYVFKGWKLVGGDDTVLTERFRIASGVSSNLKFEAVYEEGIVVNVYKMGYSSAGEQTYVVSQIITIPKVSSSEFTYEDLCDALERMFVPFSGGNFGGIYLDSALSIELDAYPTGNINIYFKEIANA